MAGHCFRVCNDCSSTFRLQNMRALLFLAALAALYRSVSGAGEGSLIWISGFSPSFSPLFPCWLGTEDEAAPLVSRATTVFLLVFFAFGFQFPHSARVAIRLKESIALDASLSVAGVGEKVQKSARREMTKTRAKRTGRTEGTRASRGQYEGEEGEKDESRKCWKRSCGSGDRACPCISLVEAIGAWPYAVAVNSALGERRVSWFHRSVSRPVWCLDSRANSVGL